ncbi:sodium-independent sulfate anion transporter-like isoform X5 [Penaeus monodon]|uniref:sodium-independent sulfate anion transporter-like isoform X5 n=1 Tax=Penaeus monodon TaxID=6687 RepID=UPI0018A79F62|nr:sodium-independent sulfate anion transporter-like isoform X5 [Penaeus monodon]
MVPVPPALPPLLNQPVNPDVETPLREASPLPIVRPATKAAGHPGADGAANAGAKAQSRPTMASVTSNATNLLSRKVRGIFTKKTLNARLPITQWLPKYNLEMLEGDVLAGFTVGLTVIPQGIAYAIVAGLDANYGLYSAFMGCFVYTLLGSCKDITIGPTAIMAIMTHEYSGAGGADFAVLLCFLSGLIILASGICNLGFLIMFISKPVICGFTSAAAITIASSQLKGLFGLSYDAEGFLDTCKKLFQNIAYTKWQDITLGICCMICLLLMRKLKDLKAVKPNEADSTGKKVFKKIIFLSSVGRNAIVVIVAGVIAFAAPEGTFNVTGDVQGGMPSFKPPPFSTEVNNVTYSFGDMMASVGSGVVIIPLISILESIAIASAFAGGKTIDATQEMIALGFCNIMGAFVQSMPVTGSFSRTAVNATSGVRTPAGGVVTGVLVVLALAFLTPYFRYIPKATLSAVIICAVIFMVEYEMVLPIWRARKLDQLPLWGSFLTCLFWKLEYGILVGVGINLAILLYGTARPKVGVTAVMRQDGDEPAYVLVEPRSGLFFPSIDHVRSVVSKAGRGMASGNLTVVVDCKHFVGVDFTAAKGIKGLCMDYEKRHQDLIFINVTPGVERGLRSVCDNLTIVTSQFELHNSLKSMESSGVCGNGVIRHENGVISNHTSAPETYSPGHTIVNTVA